MSSIHPTALIDPKAEIASDCTIGPWVFVGSGVKIGQGCKIGSRVMIDGVTSIGDRCRIETGAVIGSPPQDLKYKGEPTRVQIGNDCVIREYVTINRATGEGNATCLGNRCFLMAYAHVAHNCYLEDEVIMANVATLGGHIQIGRGAIIGGIVAIHQFCRVGQFALVGGASGVSKDVIPFVMASGSPARPYGLNRVGLKRRGFSKERIRTLRRAYKRVFRMGYTEVQALKALKKDFTGNPDVEEIIGFIEGTQRGLCR